MYSENKFKADLQVFYLNFYIGLYMYTYKTILYIYIYTCQVYNFYLCPAPTVISLSIFAVQYSTKLEIYWLYFKLLHLHCG